MFNVLHGFKRPGLCSSKDYITSIFQNWSGRRVIATILIVILAYFGRIWMCSCPRLESSKPRAKTTQYTKADNLGIKWEPSTVSNINPPQRAVFKRCSHAFQGRILGFGSLSRQIAWIFETSRILIFMLAEALASPFLHSRFREILQSRQSDRGEFTN